MRIQVLFIPFSWLNSFKFIRRWVLEYQMPLLISTWTASITRALITALSTTVVWIVLSLYCARLCIVLCTVAPACVVLSFNVRWLHEPPLLSFPPLHYTNCPVISSSVTFRGGGGYDHNNVLGLEWSCWAWHARKHGTWKQPCMCGSSLLEAKLQ